MKVDRRIGVMGSPDEANMADPTMPLIINFSDKLREPVPPPSPINLGGSVSQRCHHFMKLCPWCRHACEPILSQGRAQEHQSHLSTSQPHQADAFYQTAKWVDIRRACERVWLCACFLWVGLNAVSGSISKVVETVVVFSYPETNYINN